MQEEIQKLGDGDKDRIAGWRRVMNPGVVAQDRVREERLVEFPEAFRQGEGVNDTDSRQPDQERVNERRLAS